MCDSVGLHFSWAVSISQSLSFEYPLCLLNSRRFACCVSCEMQRQSQYSILPIIIYSTINAWQSAWQKKRTQKRRNELMPAATATTTHEKKILNEYNSSTRRIIIITVKCMAFSWVILKVCKLSVSSIEMKITDMCHFLRYHVKCATPVFFSRFILFELLFSIFFTLSLVSSLCELSLIVNLRSIDLFSNSGQFLLVDSKKSRIFCRVLKTWSSMYVLGSS